MQELVPGQEQKLWVQSQTTFASIAKDEEGRPVCRVQKQKIWVEGVSYELQEIYGMEHAAGFRREVLQPSFAMPVELMTGFAGVSQAVNLCTAVCAALSLHLTFWLSYIAPASLPEPWKCLVWNICSF